MGVEPVFDISARPLVNRRRMYDSAKRLYRRVFDRLAYHVLIRARRSARSHGQDDLRERPNIKIVSRYNLSGGIANGARYNAIALERLGYRVERVDVSAATHNPFKQISCSPGGVFVFHCASPEIVLHAWPLRAALRTGKIIGYFAWELADVPAGTPDYGQLWDEIWTPSIFSAQSLSRYFSCPVRVVPHVLLTSSAPQVWRKGAEDLRFLTMADTRSSLVRKNPLGALRAFKLAFPDTRDVRLIIKLHITSFDPQLDIVRREADADPRVKIIDERLDRADVDRLIATSPVYVSLHRAEGFGLPLLEARLFGAAVIGTAWSGNMDFMSPVDSFLVPATQVTMFDESGVYGHVTWADPDIAAAADAMRSCYEDSTHLAAVARAGWEASHPEQQLARFAAALAMTCIAEASDTPAVAEFGSRCLQL